MHSRIGEKTGGGYAELAIAGVDVTTQLPEHELRRRAALPLAGMTACRAYTITAACRLPAPRTGADHRRLRRVGHLALQIAKSTGAEVVGSAARAMPSGYET